VINAQVDSDVETLDFIVELMDFIGLNITLDFIAELREFVEIDNLNRSLWDRYLCITR
jgi:hypothetical protein